MHGQNHIKLIYVLLFDTRLAMLNSVLTLSVIYCLDKWLLLHLHCCDTWLQLHLHQIVLCLI